MPPPARNLLIVPYDAFQASLGASTGPTSLATTIVQAPFDYPVMTALLCLGFISFFTLDEDAGLIRLKAVSDTEYYRLSIKHYDFRVSDFILDIDDRRNSIVRAIVDGAPVETVDWGTLGRQPEDETRVRLNQASSGIAYTAVYPFTGDMRGGLMYNFFQYPEAISEQHRSFMTRYTELVSAAVDHASSIAA